MRPHRSARLVARCAGARMLTLVALASLVVLQAPVVGADDAVALRINSVGALRPYQPVYVRVEIENRGVRALDLSEVRAGGVRWRMVSAHDPLPGAGRVHGQGFTQLWVPEVGAALAPGQTVTAWAAVGESRSPGGIARLDFVATPGARFELAGEIGSHRSAPLSLTTPDLAPRDAELARALGRSGREWLLADNIHAVNLRSWEMTEDMRQSGLRFIDTPTGRRALFQVSVMLATGRTADWKPDVDTALTYLECLAGLIPRDADSAMELREVVLNAVKLVAARGDWVEAERWLAMLPEGEPALDEWLGLRCGRSPGELRQWAATERVRAEGLRVDVAVLDRNGAPRTGRLDFRFRFVDSGNERWLSPQLAGESSGRHSLLFGNAFGRLAQVGGWVELVAERRDLSGAVLESLPARVQLAAGPSRATLMMKEECWVRLEVDLTPGVEIEETVYIPVSQTLPPVIALVPIVGGRIGPMAPQNIVIGGRLRGGALVPRLECAPVELTLEPGADAVARVRVVPVE